LWRCSAEGGFITHASLAIAKTVGPDIDGHHVVAQRDAARHLDRRHHR
jgi:hypothetical protein